MGLEGFDFVENAQVPRNDWSAAAKPFIEEQKAQAAAQAEANARAKAAAERFMAGGANAAEDLRGGAKGWNPFSGAPNPLKAENFQAAAKDAGRAVATVLHHPATQRAIKVFGAAQGLRHGVDAVTQAQQGDYAGALDRGLQAVGDVAGTMAGRAGGAGMAYSVGHAAGDYIYRNKLSEDTKDSIGGTLNQLLQNWSGGRLGVDDRALMDAKSTAPWYTDSIAADLIPRPSDPADVNRTGVSPSRVGPMRPSQPPGPQATQADPQYAAREAARFADQAKQSMLPLRDQGPTGPAVPGGIAVARQPNGVLEFSGTDVKGPVSYDGAGAAGFRPSGAGVNSMPAAGFMSGSNGSALSMPEYSDVIRAKLAAMQDAQGASLRQGGPVARHSGNDWQARIDLRNLETSASSSSASPETKKAYAEARQLDQLAKAGADPNTLARIQAATSNYGQDAHLLGTKYAADQQLRGHQFTAQNQYRVGQQEFFQKQQDRSLMQTLMQMTDDNPRKAADLATKAGRPDLGNLLLDNYEKGIKASSSVSSGNDTSFKNVLDTVLKTVPDRDANKDARYARSLQAHMGNEIARLEEYVTKHPEDKDSASQLTRLRRRDMSVMEGNSEAMLRFSLGMRLKEMAEKNHGIMPWAGTTVMQDEPVRYISKEVIPASVAGVNLPGHRGFYRTNRGDLIPVADVENDPLFSISPPHSNTFATMKR